MGFHDLKYGVDIEALVTTHLYLTEREREQQWITTTKHKFKTNNRSLDEVTKWNVAICVTEQNLLSQVAFRNYMRGGPWK